MCATMLVVAGVVTAILLVTQSSLQQTHTRFFREQFAMESRSFVNLQESRLGSLKERCRALSLSVRLIAAFDRLKEGKDNESIEDLYDNGRIEVIEKPGAGRARLEGAFLRFLDAKGEIIPPTAKDVEWTTKVSE